MAIDIKNDFSQHFAVVRGTGELSYEEVTDNISSFYKRVSDLNVLWDLRHATVSRISSDQVQKIAAMIQKMKTNRKGGKTAIVAQGDEAFGLARMLQTLYSVSVDVVLCDIKVFRDINTASNWLNHSG